MEWRNKWRQVSRKLGPTEKESKKKKSLGEKKVILLGNRNRPIFTDLCLENNSNVGVSRWGTSSLIVPLYRKEGNISDFVFHFFLKV